MVAHCVAASDASVIVHGYQRHTATSEAVQNQRRQTIDRDGDTGAIRVDVDSQARLRSHKLRHYAPASTLCPNAMSSQASGLHGRRRGASTHAKVSQSHRRRRDHATDGAAFLLATSNAHWPVRIGALPDDGLIAVADPH